MATTVVKSTETSPTWEELLGSKNWEGLVEPELEENLRNSILRCGDFCQATYDCFNSNPISPQCGNSRYGKDTFFHDVMLENASRYQVVSFIYATSGLGDVRKNLFLHPNKDLLRCNPFCWDSESNWMGYVAVSSDKVSKANGRREIYVAWRGTITRTEWESNLFGAIPVSAKPLLSESSSKKVDLSIFWEPEPKIHEGWLSIYTSNNSTSNYVKTSARVQLTNTIKELTEKYKNEKLSIVVTGHSLGGAMATISAFDLVENDVVGPDVPVSAFVFGCPQVGNRQLKKRVEAHSNLKIFHVKNIRDIVPNLPDFHFSIYVPLDTIELEIDTNKSPYLKTIWFKLESIADFHNLQANLHIVAGWNGADSKYELKVRRSLALVNKSSKFLKDEYNIPESWWVEKNKGMVFDEKTGEWVLDPPPPTNQMLSMN
ncbi:phospholipase A1-IIdelta-like [Humulus lupulus]|uniref:phospholipase A1-IIdelta-like n=1 Tax=Humulus lupulus TaxID=3486 RepID=UPI002B416BDC|nr:phospholipase A1-IIdelta-like [Humulus lupulus]